MLNLLRWIARLLIALVLVIGAVLIFGPVEQVALKPAFDATTIGPDIDACLAATEARFPDITSGTAKQVIWAGAPGAKTPLAVVYLHGFSATSAEIRPVPDLVAKALGANLSYTRLTGHGLTGTPPGTAPGAALGAAMPEDWIADTAEALAIGRRLGDQRRGHLLDQQLPADRALAYGRLGPRRAAAGPDPGEYAATGVLLPARSGGGRGPHPDHPQILGRAGPLGTTPDDGAG
jgi:hypothetical protein